AGADRSTGGRERTLASLHARVETPSEILGAAVQIHGPGVRTRAAPAPARAAGAPAAGPATMFTRSSPNAGRPLNDRRVVRFEASAAYRCRAGRGVAGAVAAVSRGRAGSCGAARRFLR